MHDLKSYHQAYIDACSTNIKKLLHFFNSCRNLLIAVAFLSLYIIFVSAQNIFLIKNQNKENEIAFDINNIFFTEIDEITYSNIFNRPDLGIINSEETLSSLNYYDFGKFRIDEITYSNIFNRPDLDIINSEETLSSLNYYDFRKFHDETQKYKNNLSKDFIQLKKVGLSLNLSKRKKEFINMILPIIIYQNQKILAERQRLVEVKNYLNQNKTLNNNDQDFIENLASRYSLSINNRHKIDIINDLLISYDIIPNSIVLAQAANESGWGSSRFAKDYNALFGEYTYDNKKGIVPSQRAEGKKHLIKFFPSFEQSVESYFNNINSHFAYLEFRKLRSKLRALMYIPPCYHNKAFNINLLVDKLGVYAEDINYVKTIRSIIVENKLTEYDNIQSLITKL